MRLIRLTLLVFAFFLMTAPGFSQKPEIYVQTGHSSYVFSVAFSPDGKTLASGSRLSTIKLWDVGSGQIIHVFASTIESVSAKRF